MIFPPIPYHLFTLKHRIMANRNQDWNDRPYRSGDEWDQQHNRGYGQRPDWNRVNDQYGNGSQRDSYGRRDGGDYGSGEGGYRPTQYGSSTDHNYSADRERQDWGRGRVDSGMGDRDYHFQDRRFGQAAYEGRYGSDTNRYRDTFSDRGYRDRGYGGYEGYDERRGGQRDDRSWWDRTRDEVASWFGDDGAERRRRQDIRYESGHRGRGPKDYQRSEDRIREDVCDRLSDDDYLDASDIQVQVQGNEVVLSGNVKSRDQKRRAEDIVESISGVRHVENRIRVEYQNTSNDRGTNPSDNRGQAW